MQFHAENSFEHAEKKVNFAAIKFKFLRDGTPSLNAVSFFFLPQLFRKCYRNIFALNLCNVLFPYHHEAIGQFDINLHCSFFFARIFC